MTNIVKYFVICIVSNTFFISPGVCQNSTSDSPNILYSDSDSDLRNTNEYEYSKTLTIGKKWKNTFVDVWTDTTWDVWRIVESSEKIDDLEVYAIRVFCESPCFTNQVTYAFEKDKKIYSCKQDGSDPHLILNFNISMGDTIEKIYNGNVCGELICIDDKIVEIKGIPRRILKLQPKSSKSSFYWVEGVGAKDDDSLMIVYTIPSNGYYERGLEACYQDDTLIFDVEDFNMTNEVKELHCDEYNLENRSKELYDLSGKKLREYPKGEIFIENGKKRIMH